MKVEIDASTLEAMRKLAGLAYYTSEQNEWRDTIRSFLSAHDSARDAERDEALAEVLYLVWERTHVGDPGSQWATAPKELKVSYLKQARAARDFIAKEQGQ